MTPPAGWYPDPRNSVVDRWWDGQAWTGATRPRSTASTPAPSLSGVRQQLPPARRNKRRWPWVVGGVFAFLAFVAVATGGSEESGPTPGERAKFATPTSLSPAEAEAVDRIRREAEASRQAAPSAARIPMTTTTSNVGIGRPVRDGKFEFIVHSWDGATASLTITNIGDRPNSVAVSAQYLFDTQGRRFEPEFDWTSDLAFADLNPGQSVSGTLTYVLSGATPAHLELHDSIFSGGVEVSLR